MRSSSKPATPAGAAARSKSLLALLIALLLGGGAICCGSGEAPPLRVGTSLGYAPLSFVEDGEMRGIEIDFARRAAEELGRELRLVELPLPRLIDALLEEQVDVVMSGLSITDERAEQVAFCDPYLQVGQMALIRAEEFEERSERANFDRSGVRVGVKRGSTGEDFAQSRLKRSEVRVFDTIDAAIAALREERIDYFVHDAPTIWRVVGGFASDETQLTGLYRPLTEEYLAWAVRPGDTELRAQLNRMLATWREEGFVELTLDLWIPVRKITIKGP
jgi:ABC-type amino acid transport substrate-binding protein